MTLQRIILPDGSPPTTLVRQAAAAIAAGKCVVLPTETVYGFAADPRQRAQIQSLRALKNRAAKLPFTHHLAAAADLATITKAPGDRVMRLVNHYWPGPLTLILEAIDGQDIGLRVPAQAFTQRVIQQGEHPLLLTSVNPSGDPALTDPQAIIDHFGTKIDLFFDAGPSPGGIASTVLRCTDPVFEILREGAIAGPELLAEAATLSLFVCTGNTCRSPMAEAYANQAMAQKLGVTPNQLLARGFQFASAGTSAFDGAPASQGSLEAAAEIGCDLSSHSSQMLCRDMIARATHIYCLSESHLDLIASCLPPGSDKAQLLDPKRAVPDPIGSGIEVYRQTRDHIARAVDARLTEIAGSGVTKSG